MSLGTGLIYSFLIIVLGACALTALAIYFRAHSPVSNAMQARKQFTAIIEKYSDTGLYVGQVPGMPGAHTQGATLDEVNANLKELLEMLLEDGIAPESEFVGTHIVTAR